MNFLHYEVELTSDDAVQVDLDRQANVKLMDAPNFAAYRQGSRHTFYGGLAKVSPIVLAAPSVGHWHVVIDLGGFSGQVNASVNIKRKSAR